MWSPHTQSNIHKLEMVQRRTIRWVKHDFSRYTSVTDLQNALGWSTLEKRRLDSRLVKFYRIYHNLVAISLPPYLVVPNRLSRHMHPYSLCLPHARSDFFKYSFFPHATNLWNGLPAPVATLPTIESFKQAVAQLP